jgi:hypothetical protein
MAVGTVLRYVVLDDGKTGTSGDYHDDTGVATAIAEQVRLWQPMQVEVVSLADELGIAQPVTPDPYADTSPQMAQLLADRGTG